MGFSESRLIPLVDEGLGNSAYLVDLGDGRALAVDASRDLRSVREVAERRDLVVAFAADTHLHADFLSGARQLAATDQATVLASATGRRAFDHVALADEDEVDLGGLTLRALATPGHTEEHLSFLLLDGDRPLGVFTGGSLIVGSAARTDLVDPSRTRELAHAQYRSLRRLAALPDDVAVWPTHGAGSFCSAAPGGRRASTIGAERAANPLLNAADADDFADRLIGGLGSFPPYFLRLAEQNRIGPPVGAPVLPHLAAADLPEDAVVVDVRPVAQFAAGHIPGSLSIPLRDQFATWLGWLLDPATPVVVVRAADQDPAEVLWQAYKIGYERLLGEFGFDTWSGEPARLSLIRPVQVGSAAVLDIRQDAEFRAGHLPGARHIELGDLPTRPVGDEPLVVMCGHGERAATAASLLLNAGHRDVAVLAGGPSEWARSTGRSLADGP